MNVNKAKGLEVDMRPELAELEPSPGLGGLLALVGEDTKPLPLVKVVARAQIAGDRCHTTIEQHFQNPYERPLRATHIFPLPSGAAVTEMELVAGDTVVRAVCREREEAERIFDAAQADGYRAGLLTAERADVHTLRVTNLPPKTDVHVRFTLLETLDTIDGNTQWRFPTVIAPRYTPGEPLGHEGPGITPDTDHVPDASRLQPPLRLEGGATLDLEAVIYGDVREVASSLHAIQVSIGGEASGIRVAPSVKATLDRDFVLFFSCGEEKTATAHALTDGGYTLVTITPPQIEPEVVLPRDAAFVLDTSGSMGGAKLEAAKLAMKTALRGLREGDRFNLIEFNSGYWPFSSTYTNFDQASLERADAWISKLQARGGTELLGALRAALADREEGRPGTVLIITDGQVTNEAEVFAAVHNRRKGARIFTLGIDTAVNESMLKRLARAGGGTCTLLTPQDDIEAAVARLEATIGSPLVDNLNVSGGDLADPRPQTLFAGRPVSMILEGVPKQVAITGIMSDESFQLKSKPERIEFPLAALWASERVAYLEDRMALKPFEEEALQPEIIKVALAHNIVSRFTAFVAVDTSLTVKGERVEVVQPVELPMEWDDRFQVGSFDQISRPKSGSLLARIESGFESPKFMAAHDEPRHIARRRPLHGMRDTYYDLKSRVKEKILKNLGTSLDTRNIVKFRQTIETEFENVLNKEKIVLSRPERRRLFERIVTDLAGPTPETQDGIDRLVAELAIKQRADGSFYEDLARTAAAVICLALIGHTRQEGLRKRVVAKAARWLEGHKNTAEGAIALDILERIEAGEERAQVVKAKRADMQKLLQAGSEAGQLLSRVLQYVTTVDE